MYLIASLFIACEVICAHLLIVIGILVLIISYLKPTKKRKTKNIRKLIITKRKKEYSTYTNTNYWKDENAMKEKNKTKYTVWKDTILRDSELINKINQLSEQKKEIDINKSTNING